MSSEYLLKIENLSISYDSRVILQNVNFSAEYNEVVVLIGQSGCGKTSVLNALAGFIPFRGEVKKPHSLSYVFQDHSLYPWLNVKQNILLGRPDLTQKQIIDFLSAMGLFGFERRYPHELSGGQKQRVTIARALVSKSKLILMDEPFSSLDVITRQKMQRWLASILSKQKKSVIFVTHDLEEALIIGDRIISLSQSSFLNEIKNPFSKSERTEKRHSIEFYQAREKLSSLI